MDRPGCPARGEWPSYSSTTYVVVNATIQFLITAFGNIIVMPFDDIIVYNISIDYGDHFVMTKDRQPWFFESYSL